MKELNKKPFATIKSYIFRSRPCNLFTPKGKQFQLPTSLFFKST